MGLFIMAVKNNIDVIIGGKVLTLSGYESEEYLHQVGTYINHKISEVTQSEGFKHLSFDIQNMYIELNIADDYFKAKKQAEYLEGEIALKDKEMYNFKHDLINEKLKREEAQDKIEALKTEINELQKTIVKLETKLKDSPNSREK
jgi:cell division protein ZapA